METRQSMFEDPSRGSKHTMYFPCQLRTNNIINITMRSYICTDMHLYVQYRCEVYPLVWVHDDGLLVLLGHQHTGAEGGLEHVDDQVVGQDVQFLHLVPGHVGAPSNAIASQRGKRSRLR